MSAHPDLFTAVLQGTVDRVTVAGSTAAPAAGFVLTVRVRDAWPAWARARRIVHRLTVCWPDPSPADRARLQPGARLTVYATPSRSAARTRVWVVTTGVFLDVPGATVAPSTAADDTAEKAAIPT